jgi:hypothetical protein
VPITDITFKFGSVSREQSVPTMKPNQRRPRKGQKDVAAARGQPASGDTVEPDSNFTHQSRVLSNPFQPRNLQELALNLDNDQLDQYAVERRQRDKAHNSPAGNFYNFDLDLNLNRIEEVDFAEPAADATPLTIAERLRQSAYQLRLRDEDGTHWAIELGLYDNFDPEGLNLPQMEEADFQQPLNPEQILQYDCQGALADGDDVQRGFSFGEFGDFIVPQVEPGRIDQVDFPEPTNGVQRTFEESRIVEFPSAISSFSAIDTSSTPSISRSSFNIELPAQSPTAESIREVTPIGNCPEISNEEFNSLIDDLYRPSAKDETVADNAEIAVHSSQKVDARSPSPADGLDEPMDLVASSDEDPTPKVSRAKSPSFTVAPAIARPNLKSAYERQTCPKKHDMGIQLPRQRSNGYTARVTQRDRTFRQPSLPHHATTTQSGSATSEKYKPYASTMRETPYKKYSHGQGCRRFRTKKEIGTSSFPVAPQSNFTPSYSTPNNSSALSCYSGHSGHSGQAGHAPQAGYAPQTGYDPQNGYAPQTGYAPQHGYAAQHGYSAQASYSAQPRYSSPRVRHKVDREYVKVQFESLADVMGAYYTLSGASRDGVQIEANGLVLKVIGPGGSGVRPWVIGLVAPVGRVIEAAMC